MNTVLRVPIRVRHETKRRMVQVSRVEPLSPHMRRITFAGDELEGFVSAAPDDHVKIFFPSPAGGEPVMRDYTPRRFNAATRELVVEFVLHGTGPASAWAAQASPGQWLSIGGPRGSFLMPDDCAGYILAGDETALPAIARFLEEMRPGAPVVAFIEVADRDEERLLPTAASAAITWLHRDGTPPGGPLLAEAMAASARPQGDVLAWVAAEIEVARAVRRILTEDLGMPRSQVRAAGYWRQGHAATHTRLDD